MTIHHDKNGLGAEVVDLADVFLYERIRRSTRAIERAAETVITSGRPNLDAIERGAAILRRDLDEAVDELIDRRRN